MREKLMRFMAGRYSMDQLSDFLIKFALVFAVFNVFFRNGFVEILCLAALIFAYVRIFSKNHERCRRQNSWYLQKTWKIRSVSNKYISRIKILRTHHIYTCGHCKQKLKIPRGRGRVQIRCPKCGNEFIKKS